MSGAYADEPASMGPTSNSNSKKMAKLLGEEATLRGDMSWDAPPFSGATPQRAATLAVPNGPGSEVSPWNLPINRDTRRPSLTGIRIGGGPTPSIKNGEESPKVAKKRKGFMSKILRKASSRVDLDAAENSDGGDVYGEFTGGGTSLPPLAVSLPAKLKARGDSADRLPTLASKQAASPKSSSRRRKASVPFPQPPTRGSVSTPFGMDPVDLDLSSMAGIVDFAAVDSRANGLGSLAGSRNASNSDVDELGGPLDIKRYSVSSHPTSRDSSGLSASAESQTPASWKGRNQRETSTASSIGFWSGPQHNIASIAEPISPTSMVPPRRPGMQRIDSTYSINGEASKEPSVVGAWTAPDSWAVKGDGGAIEHGDSDDTDAGEDGADADDASDVSDPDSPKFTDAGTIMSGGDEGLGSNASAFGRPQTSNGRPGTRSGRPSTSEGVGSRAANQRSFIIRIFRQDSTFSTLPATLSVTAGELNATLSRKFQPVGSQRYALYIRDKGYERRVGPNEKPVLLQKRRLEQAGYTELDKLEDIVFKEDNSYLSRLVYRTVETSRPVPEDDVGENLEFIDLSGRKVETIPIPLYKNAHEIVSLKLSNNRPFELPTDFVQSCTSLRDLTLSHMGIKRIPQAVKECHSLTRLDISNNHIVELDSIDLFELRELTSLKCHNNRLWKLPDYFSQLKSLKFLNLSNNRFDKFPSIVCDIPSLTELDLSFNTITSIPTELGSLASLERLLLIANGLTGLTPSISQLHKLKELDCRRNSLADLSSISAIPNLEVLRVDYNQASALDATWPRMRFLSASNNSLTRFNISGTSNTLTSLNLSHAKLALLAVDMFEHLGSVESLTFDSNQIRVLPEGVGSLTNLVTLSIRNNLLDELPASIGRLQRLQSLQVSGNNLKSLPSSLWLCQQLTVLNASSNLLQDFPDPPLATASDAGLEEIDMRKLSTISNSRAPSTASARMAPPMALSLQKLYLGDNHLIDTVFIPISLLTELRILNLSFNNIPDVPSTSLVKFRSLEELYISGNVITTLPREDFVHLANLKLLYANGNKLQTLPSEIGDLTNLLALDVGSNLLKYNIANWRYDWNWNSNPDLRYLNFSGNKRLEIKPGHSDTSNRLPSGKPGNIADFASLTKLHVLGLMDVTMMSTTAPDDSDDRRVRTSLSQINNMAYGIADTLGSRAEVLSLVDIVIPSFRHKDDEAIFGLFDAIETDQDRAGPGAGGAKLVRYLTDSFTAIFTLELSRLKNVEVTTDALRRAFLGINRDYGNIVVSAAASRRKGSQINLSERGDTAQRAGAAGIIVYIRKKVMYVANAGNALAVISGRGGSARLISKKHDPFDATEVARVRGSEGWISAKGAVNGDVPVSRSFGCYNHTPAVNAAPNIEEIDLSDTDELVIIANAGLWDHISYQAAVDVARLERGDPMTAAAKLRDLAIAYGSSQNIMVMVVSVEDLFKAKKDFRSLRHNQDDEGFFGQQRAGGARRGGGPRQLVGGDRSLQLLNREIEPPVGHVALVFTDIRNSTALWDSNPGMQTAIRMHNQLLRRHLRTIGGYEVKTEGDAFMVSFSSCASALLWCLTVQLELLREDWPQEILDSTEGKEIRDANGEITYRGLSVRMGIHWGAPMCEIDPVNNRMDYLGPMVNRSARISAVAEGGQITVSRDVVRLIEELMEDDEDGAGSQSGDGEERKEVSDEAETWIDLEEKRDILALRRMNLYWTELGVRKLKGLETPEHISLVIPGNLKSRLKTNQDIEPVVLFETTKPLVDMTVVIGLERAVLLLEDVAARVVHQTPPSQHIRPSTNFSSAVTDDEILTLLASFVARIENVVAGLTLHQLGPFAEVLAALGGALRTNPDYILSALSRYSALL